MTPWTRAGAGCSRTCTAIAGGPDPLYRARRTLHTGSGLLTDKQAERLGGCSRPEHVEVEATWGIYQRIIGAYRHPDRTHRAQLMHAVIDDLRTTSPAD